MEKLTRFLKDEEGAIGVEYALITGGVALAIAAAVFALGASLSGWFGSVTADVSRWAIGKP